MVSAFAASINIYLDHYKEAGLGERVGYHLVRSFSGRKYPDTESLPMAVRRNRKIFF